MIFDTHAHYDDDAFSTDRESVLQQLKENGIEHVVNVSADLKSIETTLKLVEKTDFFYAAVGVHPSSTMELNEENFAWIRECCKKEKVVAVGEIGLDYHWEEPEPKVQQEWFRRQLSLARELSLPVIIHSREAAKDTFDIMKEMHAEQIGGVIHCFSYSKEMANEYVKMGFFIGIGGVVTFKNARKTVEVVESIPLSNIVLETDCPYLAPVPNRGKRNSSLYLPIVVEQIAKIKQIPEEEVIRVTNENAKRLYRL